MLILVLNMVKTWELLWAPLPGPPPRAWPLDRGFATSHFRMMHPRNFIACCDFGMTLN